MNKFDKTNPIGSFDIFSVESKGQVKKMQILVAIDLDSEDSVIGCEIINLKFNAGDNSAAFLQQLPSTRGVFPRFTYDPQVDSCYLQIKEGMAANTEPFDASAWLDSQGRIVRLSI
jgi:uncharacterized protein YuzE